MLPHFLTKASSSQLSYSKDFRTLCRNHFSSTGHSLAGHSPSPAALSAMEHLVAYAVRKGHLSPIYIQPFLVKGENCLVPLQKASSKKGKTFNLLGLPLDSPPLISNGHWGRPFPSGFHWIPTDKQLVTQLSETLPQANLEKGSPGHHNSWSVGALASCLV